MPLDVLMPEAANLIKWLKAEGEAVSAGDDLFQIETDKTVIDVMADADGVLHKILVPEGSLEVPAEKCVALIALPTDRDVNSEPDTGANDDALVNSVANHVTVQNHRTFVSPLAKRLAREAELELSAVQATGPGGRIVARDVRAAIAADESAPVSQLQMPMAAQSEQASHTCEPRKIPLDGMRRAIAQRVVQSKQVVPHFYVSCDVELDALFALRHQINSVELGIQAKAVISINDFIIKAMALALQRVPEANVSWEEDHILQFTQSDVGVAIAVENGLYTPLIRNAQSKSLMTISAEVRDLAERARRREIKAIETQGGTTTVSNLGMLGAKSFSAIISPPQSTILAVGASEPRPVVKNGQVIVAQIMTVNLSCDHRVIDGALAARFLGVFKQFMEQPISLLL